MNQCPECRSLEVDAAGVCVVCGYRADAQPSGYPQDREAGQDSGVSPVPSAPPHDQDEGKESGAGPDPSAPASYAAGLPEWRLELSRRLQEIKQRRTGPEESPNGAKRLAAPGSHISPEAGSPAGQSEKPLPARKQRRTVRPRQSVPPETLSATQPSEAGEPAATPDTRPPVPRETAEQADVVRTGEDDAGASEKQELQAIIDRAVSRSASPSNPGPAQLPLDYYNPPVPLPDDSREDRLMLLTRTLAGLVDLVLVVAFSSAFVFAVDIVEGITVFDRVSLFHYVLLLILTFFVYSTFFLATATQTVGMMITDLRVVGQESRRPGTIQIILRCSAYLLSLLLLGIGLLWGCFDKNACCLHDRFSHTRVVRIAGF